MAQVSLYSVSVAFGVLIAVLVPHLCIDVYNDIISLSATHFDLMSCSGQ